MSAEPPVAITTPEPAAAEHGRAVSKHEPVISLSDPRAVQMLSTEHWSLLSGRSLAYNEAFIRGGMFLTFLSMSFVGLALLAQAMSFTTQFLIITAVVVAFDFVIGLLTYARIAGAGADDLRYVHGMARLRHAYTEIAPPVSPYFTSPTHDDVKSVLTVYGPPSTSAIGDIVYGFSTSLGMIGLITAMVGGVLTAVIAILVGVAGDVGLIVGAASAVIITVAMVVLTFRAAAQNQSMLEARFPAPTQESAETPVDGSGA